MEGDLFFLSKGSCALGIGGVDLVGLGCYGVHWGVHHRRLAFLATL